MERFRVSRDSADIVEFARVLAPLLQKICKDQFLPDFDESVAQTEEEYVLRGLENSMLVLRKGESSNWDQYFFSCDLLTPERLTLGASVSIIDIPESHTELNLVLEGQDEYVRVLREAIQTPLASILIDVYHS